MVARAIAPVVGGVVGEIGDDLKLVLERFHGLEGLVHFVVASFTFWEPALVVGSIGEGDETHAQGHSAGGGGEGTFRGHDASCRTQGFEGGKRNADTEAAEKCSTG